MNIFIYFFLLFGVSEIASNLFHLSKGTVAAIGKSAKKQHQELSLLLSEVHFFVKAIMMLAFGILFLTAGIVALFNIENGLVIITVSVISFGAYGVLQALFYRKPVNVWLSAIVYNLPLIIFFIIK